MIPLHQFLITDGTTTLDLQNNIDYQATDYTLPIPALQRSALAGSGPYVPVTQSITLDILGDNPALCWEKFATLLYLIAQAEYWTQNQPINPVLLIAQTTDQAPTVSAYILDSPSPEEAMASYSADLIQYTGGRYVLSGVVITFRRTVWETGSSASVFSDIVINPSVMSVNWASDSSVYCRMRVNGAGRNPDDEGIYGFVRLGQPAVLLFASNSNKITVIDSVSAQTDPSDPVVETTDSGREALGNSVKRAEARTTPIPITWFLPSSARYPKRSVAVYAAVRNVSTAVPFTIQLQARTNEDMQNILAPPITIDVSTVNPRIVLLGVLNARFDLSDDFSIITAVSAGVTNSSERIMIDYIAVHVLDDPWTDRALVYDPVPTSGVTYPRNMIIEPGSSILRTPHPVVTIVGDTVAPTILRGDSYIVTKGSSVAALLLSSDPSGKWRLYDDDNSRVMRQWMGFRRTSAYLVPPGE